MTDIWMRKYMRTIKPVGKGIQQNSQFIIALRRGRCLPESPPYRMDWCKALPCQFLPLPRPLPLGGLHHSQFWPCIQGDQTQQEKLASCAPTEHQCNSTNTCRASHHKGTAGNSAQGPCHFPCGNSSGREGGEVVAPHQRQHLQRRWWGEQESPHTGDQGWISLHSYGSSEQCGKAVWKSKYHF